jgi:hypothetical protein
VPVLAPLDVQLPLPLIVPAVDALAFAPEELGAALAVAMPDALDAADGEQPSAALHADVAEAVAGAIDAVATSLRLLLGLPLAL